MGLHYVDANRVEHMAGVEVCSSTNEKLGEIDGFLIDRNTKRLEYFVVEPEATNERCLLRADNPAVLSVQERKLTVEAHPADLEHLSPRGGQRPSNEEVIRATHRSSAASGAPPANERRRHTEVWPSHG